MTEIYVQGSIPEFQFDGDDVDRYYLPTRATSFGINKPADLVLLPDSHEIEKYVEDLSCIVRGFDMSPAQTVLVPDVNYFLDIALVQNLSTLSERLNRAESFRVWPYSNTANLQNWVQELRREGFSLEVSLPPKVYFEDLMHPQHRGGWGRWVNRPDTPSFPERYGISYPISYIGRGLSEVSEAYKMTVERTGKRGAYLKPIFSAGGFTIRRIESESELLDCYSSLQSSGSLDLFGQEVPCEIQEEVTDVVAFCSVQYDGGKIVTPGTLSTQMVDGKTWTGNIFNSNLSRRIAGETQELFKRFSRAMSDEVGESFYGWGGFDMAVKMSNGKLEPIVLEHNGARITGAHPAIALAETFGVSASSFLIRKTPGNPNCDLATVWELLTQERIAYDPHLKRGVFPLLWLNGSGFLFTCGDSENEIIAVTDRAIEKVGKNGFFS